MADEIDLKKVTYRLIAYTGGTGNELNDYATDLGWEEDEDEFTTRISFNLKNEKTKSGYISSLLALGRKVVIRAKMGGTEEEVARGTIVDWKLHTGNESATIAIKCYGPALAMKVSQACLYFSAGVTTQAIFNKLCSECGVSVGTYRGPNVSHGKTTYKTGTIQADVNELLDDAKKGGSSKYVVREEKDKIQVLPYGYNSKMWTFETKHIMSVDHSRNTEKMVTRVRVIGQADKDDRSPTEATINGKTQYGIHQKLVNHSKSDTLDKAKTAAQKIIDEEGKVDETISVKTPDVPFLRKGEKVSMKAASINGNYYVVGVSHDCDAGTMTMRLRPV